MSEILWLFNFLWWIYVSIQVVTVLSSVCGCLCNTISLFLSAFPSSKCTRGQQIARVKIAASAKLPFFAHATSQNTTICTNKPHLCLVLCFCPIKIRANNQWNGGSHNKISIHIKYYISCIIVAFYTLNVAQNVFWTTQYVISCTLRFS